MAMSSRSWNGERDGYEKHNINFIPSAAETLFRCLTIRHSSCRTLTKRHLHSDLAAFHLAIHLEAKLESATLVAFSLSLGEEATGEQIPAQGVNTAGLRKQALNRVTPDPRDMGISSGAVGKGCARSSAGLLPLAGRQTAAARVGMSGM